MNIIMCEDKIRAKKLFEDLFPKEKDKEFNKILSIRLIIIQFLIT